MILHGQDLERLSDYIRGVITGDRTDYDVIATRQIEALRRQPLAEYLEDLDDNGLKLQGAATNTPRGVLDLVESLRLAAGMTKTELSEKSGVSRSHLLGLLSNPSPRPLLGTAVRLSIALNYPLEVVEQPVEATTSKGVVVEGAPRPSIRPVMQLIVASVATGLLTSLGLYAVVRARTSSSEGER